VAVRAATFRNRAIASIIGFTEDTFRFRSDLQANITASGALLIAHRARPTLVTVHTTRTH
jgi:hypothetical protein